LVTASFGVYWSTQWEVIQIAGKRLAFKIIDASYEQFKGCRLCRRAPKNNYFKRNL
jgi:hypothetical protein